MSCKQCQCAVTEEVKLTNTCTIPSTTKELIKIYIKKDTLDRIQQLDFTAKVEDLVEELVESFDW